MEIVIGQHTIVPKRTKRLTDQKLTACCILHVTLNTFAFCLLPFGGCTVAQGSDLVGLLIRMITQKVLILRVLSATDSPVPQARDSHPWSGTWAIGAGA